jgi:hypothetical protein
MLALPLEDTQPSRLNLMIASLLQVSFDNQPPGTCARLMHRCHCDAESTASTTGPARQVAYLAGPETDEYEHAVDSNQVERDLTFDNSEHNSSCQAW